MPGSQFRQRPFFSFFVRIPCFCGRGPIHKSPKFELKDIFLTTLSSWPLLLSWCEKCGRYSWGLHICVSAGTDVIRLKVFSFKQNLKLNSQKNCQKVNELKCFLILFSEAGAGWRSGSLVPLFLWGTVLFISERLSWWLSWCLQTGVVMMPTTTLREPPISDFQKKSGTVQFHKCNETHTTFDNGGW